MILTYFLVTELGNSLCSSFIYQPATHICKECPCPWDKYFIWPNVEMKNCLRSSFMPVSLDSGAKFLVGSFIPLFSFRINIDTEGMLVILCHQGLQIVTRMEA